MISMNGLRPVSTRMYHTHCVNLDTDHIMPSKKISVLSFALPQRPEACSSQLTETDFTFFHTSKKIPERPKEREREKKKKTVSVAMKIYVRV